MAIIDDSNSATRVADGTTAQRPGSPVEGDMRLNTSNSAVEMYVSGAWSNIKAFRNGLTAATAAYSGQDLVDNNPGISSGTYYINPNGNNTAIQMHVDTTEDGGGYDTYQVNSGTASSGVNGSNSCPAGTSWVYGRSRAHWDYLLTQYSNSSMQNCGSVYKTASGGSYTGSIMRDPGYYGNGANDWRVPDGGRWWLRDSTFSEPNGDYPANGWLILYGSQTAPGNTGDLGFNDGNNPTTGSTYICSTNAKA